jgi:hypothetical protein
MSRRGLALVLATLVLVGIPAQPVHAADATHCIELGDDKAQHSRTLKNTCGSEVIVFWCHNGTNKASRDSACDPGKRLYRMNSPLPPGAVKVNRFSLPLGTQLTYGACFGSWSAYALLDHTGRYLCLPQRAGGSGSEKRLLHTHQGPDVDSACAEATAAAQAFGRVSECSCESRGALAVCRVESTGKGFDSSSWINDARRQLRDVLQDPLPSDAVCKQLPCPPPRAKGGSGVRG